jgi:hypothetical protein
MVPYINNLLGVRSRPHLVETLESMSLCVAILLCSIFVFSFAGEVSKQIATPTHITNCLFCYFRRRNLQMNV